MNGKRTLHKKAMKNPQEHFHFSVLNIECWYTYRRGSEENYIGPWVTFNYLIQCQWVSQQRTGSQRQEAGYAVVVFSTLLLYNWMCLDAVPIFTSVLPHSMQHKRHPHITCPITDIKEHKAAMKLLRFGCMSSKGTETEMNHKVTKQMQYTFLESLRFSLAWSLNILFKGTGPSQVIQSKHHHRASPQLVKCRPLLFWKTCHCYYRGCFAEQCNAIFAVLLNPSYR